jgi:hypothetical protein
MSSVLYEHSILRCDVLGQSFLVVGYGISLTRRNEQVQGIRLYAEVMVQSMST